MSKIAILGDTHFGIKNDSPIFLEYFLSFFEKQFFPYLKANNIKHIIHLGDVMDRRKYTSHATLNQVKKRFFDVLVREGIEMVVVIGNHDTVYKNTNEINSTEEFFSHYKNITICPKPRAVKVSQTEFNILPWITTEGEPEAVEFLDSCSNSILLGHIEISGFQVLRGVNCEHGLSKSLFKKFELVLSGHFHQRQYDEQFVYTGTPYQLDGSDLNETKGFYTLDETTHAIDYIVNEDKMFRKIIYDDSTVIPDYSVFDFSEFSNRCVRIIVESKKSPYALDKLIDGVYAASPFQVQVIDNTSISSTNVAPEIVNNDAGIDTISFLTSEVDSLTGVADLAGIKHFVRDLYTEAYNHVK